jgi:hypothetical protein
MSINYFPFESKSGFKSPNFTVDHLGNVVIGGDLVIEGLTIDSGTINLNPTEQSNIDNIDIGQNIPALGTFTDLSVLNNLVLNPTNRGSIDNIDIGNLVEASGYFTNLSANLSVILNPSNGGTIENISIGLTDPTTANFTNVTLTETPTQSNQVITKGYVDSRIPALAIALGA